ncbi:MAG TPA: hypothetical protein DHV16_09305 [Nitrospiraceae bacterium]|nr:MAG: hypothetical protein A2Z82_00975 [Nitrospirae bacterium GWA2_46_11]HAK88929.1 hypothetical protein [Nitrospiraceae bacterium]HCZ12426.1 hypothetical protein [Nitrospiraceae bacterium]
MTSSLGEFGKTAQKLARNPLGIIALFIVLVYGIAALVLGISSNNLQTYEKLPLIYFLVIFPIIVLIVFYRLVSKHHVKLYAPDDFRDKEGFFRALSPLEQKQKLDEEIKSIEEESKTSETSTSKTPLSVEMEGAGFLKSVTTRHAYVLAEELAFREIEREFGVYVHRQVAIGPDYGVDGIFQYGEKSIAIEIKYSKRPQHIRAIMQREIERFSKLGQDAKGSSVLLLVIVSDGWTSEQKKNELDILTIMARETIQPIKLRIYDFDELKTKYGISEIGTQ